MIDFLFRVSLLPNKFHRAFHLPSFDIKDLHTVDRLVLGIRHILLVAKKFLGKIYDELARDDWTILIAHTLGILEGFTVAEQLNNLLWFLSGQILLFSGTYLNG